MKRKLFFMLFAFFSVFAGRAQKWEPSPKRQPNLFLIPNGYVGWLHVEYGIKGAPALPTQKGFRVYKFPRKGTIRTSSPLLFGWAKDKTYYTTPKGWKELMASEDEGKGMIWGSFISNGDMTVSDSKGHVQKYQSLPQKTFLSGRGSSSPPQKANRRSPEKNRRF